MSFDEHFEELAALAYRTAHRILGDRAVAEEIAQETLAKAYSRWSRVSDHARPWVCRAAANEAISEVRRRQRRQRRHGTVPDGARAVPAGHDDGGVAAVRLDLQRLLLCLPRRQRDVVVLRFVADMTEPEVAESLGIAVGTVKTHARRGLEALRRSIGPDVLLPDSPEENHDARPAR